jgi:hypothetical protein
MANQVAPPDRVTYRYGLLSVAQGPREHVGPFRLVADYAFDSVACNEGLIWEPECGPVYTVTFTKSATADTFNVTVTPGVVGNYEVSVNGAAFTALTATVVSTDAAPTPVIVREAAGLRRSVSHDLNFDSSTGTVYKFVSAQTDNGTKEFTQGIGAPSASPFTVVGGAACTPMADYDWAALGQQALQAVEQPLVEKRFWNVQLANSSPALPVGATAQTLVNGVAVLEEYARGLSGFEPVLHTSSFLGAHAAADRVVPVVSNDQVKYTALHTPIAFGGGYQRTGPAGQSAPGASQAWMYITGQVVVHRSAARYPGSEGERFVQASNQLFIMGERDYAVIPDCPIAAVLVDADPA